MRGSGVWRRSVRGSGGVWRRSLRGSGGVWRRRMSVRKCKMIVEE